MRTEKEIQHEIKKLRLVMKTGFNEKSKDAAWASMLSLQWALSDRKTMTLTPTDLTGINMDEAISIKKAVKRKK